MKTKYMNRLTYPKIMKFWWQILFDAELLVRVMLTH